VGCFLAFILLIHLIRLLYIILSVRKLCLPLSDDFIREAVKRFQQHSHPEETLVM
jgi:hypothetical protein